MFVEKLKQKDFDNFVDAVYNDDYENNFRAVVSSSGGIYYLRVEESNVRESSVFLLNDFTIKAFNNSAVVDANCYKELSTTWRKFLARKFGKEYTEAYTKFRQEEIEKLNNEIDGR